MPSPPPSGFDNRLSLRMGKLHLGFTLGGKRILYAYIRKNGCSCFKSAIQMGPDTPISEIPRSYKVFSPLGRYDARIFVWRDPEERLVSLYRNKILDRRNASDLVARYQRVMKEEPSTFEKFALFAASNADPHLYPQRYHLHPIRYTHAIELRTLHTTMAEIAGSEAAEIFRSPLNSSIKTPVSVTPHARELIHRHYKCDYDMIEKIKGSDSV